MKVKYNAKTPTYALYINKPIQVHTYHIYPHMNRIEKVTKQRYSHIEQCRGNQRIKPHGTHVDQDPAG